jgi:CubicO group peptidase (beta-lactamase class C family)
MGIRAPGRHHRSMSPEPQLATPSAVGRRTLFGVGLGGVAAAGLAACTGPSAPAATTSPSAGAASAAPSGGTGSNEIDAAGVQRGLAALPGIIDRYLKQTTVPGLAAVVVYQGETRYLEGFGVRQQGKPDAADADTVFQLASVSKPISSTVVAAALTKKLSKLGWDDPVQRALPDFTLSDAWVGSHVTVADMFAHRSGLPDHSGNLLEDFGFTRAQILAKHRYYPLRRFRDNYEYTNYGLTAGAEAIAVACGMTWEELADQVLFGPLGMKSTSFRFPDLQKRANRAAMHEQIDGAWVPNLTVDTDAQAPAGSSSSSVRDLAAWITMLLAGGGSTIDENQLKRIWLPAIVRPGLPAIGSPAGFYGMGWIVSYEPTGELRLNHSGGFGLGAATTVTLYPSKGLGIAVITNAPPIGLPEAVTVEFTDVVRYGKSTQDDWVAVIGPHVAPEETADNKKYSVAAKDPKPARAKAAYTGRYTSRLYGPLTVTQSGGTLAITVGPARRRFELQHYSGDEFFFATTGEDASGLSGATFRVAGGRATALTVGAWNKEKLGTFTRA